jgi:hypothetical protein
MTYRASAFAVRIGTVVGLIVALTVLLLPKESSAAEKSPCLGNGRFLLGGYIYVIPWEVSPFDSASKAGRVPCEIGSNRVVTVRDRLILTAPPKSSRTASVWPYPVTVIELARSPDARERPNRNDLQPATEHFLAVNGGHPPTYLSKDGLIQGAKVTLNQLPRRVDRVHFIARASYDQSMVRIPIWSISDDPESVVPTLTKVDKFLTSIRIATK